jgi:hypothetical protein
VEVIGELRRLHREKLNNLYDSPNAVKMTKYMRMRWEVHAAGVGEMRNVYKIPVRKPEGNIHLLGTKHR